MRQRKTCISCEEDLFRTENYSHSERIRKRPFVPQFQEVMNYSLDLSDYIDGNMQHNLNQAEEKAPFAFKKKDRIPLLSLDYN